MVISPSIYDTSCKIRNNNIVILFTFMPCSCVAVREGDTPYLIRHWPVFVCRCCAPAPYVYAEAHIMDIDIIPFSRNRLYYTALPERCSNFSTSSTNHPTNDCHPSLINLDDWCAVGATDSARCFTGIVRSEMGTFGDGS